MSIISVRDLVVEYEGRRVLDGLNLEIEPGQITVLLEAAVQERAHFCGRFSVSSVRGRAASRSTTQISRAARKRISRRSGARSE